MSFSNEVKREILSAINNRDKKFACLYGILLYCKKMSSNIITIQSENTEVMDFTENLFNDLFKDKIHLRKEITRKIKNNPLYSFIIKDKGELSEIFEFYETKKREEILLDRNLKCSFLAGAFLICGSINSPSKEYHLEFIVSNETKAEILKNILLETGITAKITERKNNFVVYIKDSESIEDALTYMGAKSCTLEIINFKIYKDFCNKANRIRNCDTANINRTINASLNQIKDINIIENEIGLENISEELREVAVMRLNNSEMTLKEIGESLEHPISRSGVNHRFKKISAIAEDIRQGKEIKNE